MLEAYLQNLEKIHETNTKIIAMYVRVFNFSNFMPKNLQQTINPWDFSIFENNTNCKDHEKN